MFAKVESGAVTEVLNNLPKAHKFSDGSSTGNFSDMTVTEQVTEGYYPLEEVEPQGYDSRIHTLVIDNDDIQAAKVVRTYTKQDIAPDDLKAAQIAQVKLLLNDKLNDSEFTFDNKVFKFMQKTPEDAAQLQAFLTIDGAALPQGFSWNRADGSEHPMDITKFRQFASAVASHKLALVDNSKTHIAAIKALDDALDIVTYDYSGGW